MEFLELTSLFFFDPRKSWNEYTDYYIAVNPERYLKEKGFRISPLFALNKDLRSCLLIGKEYNGQRNRLNEIQFGSIILLSIAMTQTVKTFYSGRYESFAEDFMGIDGSYVKPLRYLRNALEHSYYGLFTYVQNEDGKVKYYYSIGFHDQPISEDKAWKRPYPSKLFLVNHRMLYSSWERGIKELRKKFEEPRGKTKKTFEERVSLDEWIFIPKTSLPSKSLD